MPSLAGLLSFWQICHTVNFIWGSEPFITMLPHFTATKSCPGPNLHKALLAMFFFLWIPYLMALSICPFFTLLCICMVRISLNSILSSVLFPDVTEYIMQNTCISCRSLTPIPLPVATVKDCVCVRACVCVTACQTWTYGVPPCQHMPEGFSMPVLAHGHMCMLPRPACCCLQR